MASFARSDTAAVHILHKGCDTWLTIEQLSALPVHVVTVTERDGS
jgi:hypothetical protein